VDRSEEGIIMDGWMDRCMEAFDHACMHVVVQLLMELDEGLIFFFHSLLFCRNIVFRLGIRFFFSFLHSCASK